MGQDVFDQREDEFAYCGCAYGISCDDERIVFRKSLSGKDGDERPQKDGNKRHQDTRQVDISSCSEDQINTKHCQKNAEDFVACQLFVKNRYGHKGDDDRIDGVDKGSHRRTCVFGPQELYADADSVAEDTYQDDVFPSMTVYFCAMSLFICSVRIPLAAIGFHNNAQRDEGNRKPAEHNSKGWHIVKDDRAYHIKTSP